MALLAKRKMSDIFLELKSTEEDVVMRSHILEPEYHQDIYRRPSQSISQIKNSFQLNDLHRLTRPPFRGTQPQYADDDNDLNSLVYEGMTLSDGKVIKNTDDRQNVCAIKSIAIRSGYIDLGTARSVSRSFYLEKKERASVKKNDILINSTGDGTIGRVAVYNFDFPAVVDGHVTILRFKEPEMAWYVAAFLLSDDGQKQIYRYINGSSGQVEIYPQDIERIWIRPATPKKMKDVASKFKTAVEKHDQFTKDLTAALLMVNSA